MWYYVVVVFTDLVWDIHPALGKMHNPDNQAYLDNGFVALNWKFDDDDYCGEERAREFIESLHKAEYKIYRIELLKHSQHMHV
jgi:hypothetical protein